MDESILGDLVGGVYFITAGTPDSPAGMLVSMVSHVSADPPLVMCALRHDRGFRVPLEADGGFVLHLLPADDPGLAQRLAGPPAGRFDGLDVRPSSAGQPLIADALAALECRIEARYAPGDHILYIGRVLAGHRFGRGRVLAMSDFGHAYTGRR